MKWLTEWWGIQLVAENDDDIKLLKELQGRLNVTAERFYENGKMRKKSKLMFENVDIDPKFILQFDR